MTTIAYSPWGNVHTVWPFSTLFDETCDGTSNMKGVDAFILWGGTDIHPSLYDAKPSLRSGAPHTPSPRDIWEWKALKYCKANDIPVIGVCRGAQLMCAFAGGKLFQHVNGHSQDHLVHTIEGQTFQVTSSHHQMLDLHGTEHELLAWSNQRSSTYQGEDSYTPKHIVDDVVKGTFKDPEIVYFPGMRGLAIQGHPEWAERDSAFVKYCLEAVEFYLFDKKVVA